MGPEATVISFPAPHSSSRRHSSASHCLSFRLFDTDEMLAVGHDSIVVAALLVAKPDRGRGEPAVNAPSVWTGTVINVLSLR